MADYKRSVTFSLGSRQEAMIEELCKVLGKNRSELLRDWTLRAYNQHGVATLLGSHKAPIKARIWGPNKDQCNAMLFCQVSPCNDYRMEDEQ